MDYNCTSWGLYVHQFAQQEMILGICANRFQSPGKSLGAPENRLEPRRTRKTPNLFGGLMRTQSMWITRTSRGLLVDPIHSQGTNILSAMPKTWHKSVCNADQLESYLKISRKPGKASEASYRPLPLRGSTDLYARSISLRIIVLRSSSGELKICRAWRTG